MGKKHKPKAGHNVCKIMAVAGIERENVERVAKFLAIAEPKLTQSERDGFGYAFMTDRGVVFGERWRYTYEAMKKRESKPPEKWASYERVLKVSEDYNRFGPAPNAEAHGFPVAMIAHARTAAGGGPVCLENVHPFTRELFRLTGNEELTKIGDIALVHNGIVSGIGGSPLDKSGSNECDSMAILNLYVANAVDEDIAEIREVDAAVSGSMACAVLVGDPAQPILDIWRSGGSRLWCTAVDKIGMVFCTDDDITKAVATSEGLEIQGTWQYEPGIATRIDARTGQVIDAVRYAAEVTNLTKYSGQWRGGAQHHGAHGPNGTIVHHGYVE